MYAIFQEKQGDTDGQTVDIFPSDEEEAFELGRIFERIYATGNVAWHLKHGIRIPLQRAPQNAVEAKPEQPTTAVG